MEGYRSLAYAPRGSKETVDAILRADRGHGAGLNRASRRGPSWLVVLRRNQTGYPDRVFHRIVVGEPARQREDALEGQGLGRHLGAGRPHGSARADARRDRARQTLSPDRLSSARRHRRNADRARDDRRKNGRAALKSSAWNPF